MRHARLLRGGLGVFLFGWILSVVGCTHNHYYGTGVPVCRPPDRGCPRDRHEWSGLRSSAPDPGRWR